MLVDSAMASLDRDLSDKMTQSQTTLDTLQKNLNEAQQTLLAQQQAINELRSSEHNNKDLWAVSEAQYLAKLANDNLQVGDNLPLVIRLLQTADQEVSAVTDPKALPIRKALAADIAALQAVPAVDTAGIYMQLSALNGEVDKLPLPNNRPADDASNQTADAAQAKTWWKRGLKESWKTLRQVVVVRYNASGKLPFIAPEQQQFLYQNIHAMFGQAMSAVTHKQPEIYRESLQTAITWIKMYFVQDSAATTALLTQLEKLQSTVIKPDLPDISASLQTFRDYLAAADAHADTPAATTTTQ